MLTETQPQQLLDEANKWIGNLVTYVVGINEMKSKFYKWAPGKTDHDVLVKIEHFHNQFHIQLINLHDLKHAIRMYMQEIRLSPGTDHQPSHLQLEDQYNFMINDLDNLKAEFTEFISE